MSDEQQELSQADFATHPDADRLLHEFCDRFNLPKQTPKWYLAAWYF